MTADVRTSDGRQCLFVAGLLLAAEGDPCREAFFPEGVLRDGDRWTWQMLLWAEQQINDYADAPVRC